MNDSSDASPIVGVSRREFIEYCGVIAGIIGLGEMGVPAVADAITQLTKLPLVVWSDYQECAGCTVALLQSTSPTPAELILQQVSLSYQEVAMAAAGDGANKNFEDSFLDGTFWIIEGSIPSKMPEAFSVNGKSAQDIVKANYPKAKAVIAIGSCACFGNVQAHTPNPTGAMGIRKWLRTEGGIPDAQVVNIARCPGNGEDLVTTLVYMVVNGKPPELDAQGRPLFLYGQTIHEQCERRAHFDANEFVEVYGDEGSRKNWCLYKVGCKGPVTYAPCGTTKWNGKVSWCTRNGPCTGCSEDNFWNTLTPFYQVVPNVPVPGVAGLSPQQIGIGLTALTAVGLGAHFIGQAATGRLGHGGPREHEGATRNHAEHPAGGQPASGGPATGGPEEPKGGGE